MVNNLIPIDAYLMVPVVSIYSNMCYRSLEQRKVTLAMEASSGNIHDSRSGMTINVDDSNTECFSVDYNVNNDTVKIRYFTNERFQSKKYRCEGSIPFGLQGKHFHDEQGRKLIVDENGNVLVEGGVEAEPVSIEVKDLWRNPRDGILAYDIMFTYGVNRDIKKQVRMEVEEARSRFLQQVMNFHNNQTVYIEED